MAQAEAVGPNLPETQMLLETEKNQNQGWRAGMSPGLEEGESGLAQGRLSGVQQGLV